MDRMRFLRPAVVLVLIALGCLTLPLDQVPDLAGSLLTLLGGGGGEAAAAAVGAVAGAWIGTSRRLSILEEVAQRLVVRCRGNPEPRLPGIPDVAGPPWNASPDGCEPGRAGSR